MRRPELCARPDGLPRRRSPAGTSGVSVRGRPASGEIEAEAGRGAGGSTTPRSGPRTRVVPPHRASSARRRIRARRAADQRCDVGAPARPAVGSAPITATPKAAVPLGRSRARSRTANRTSRGTVHSPSNCARTSAPRCCTTWSTTGSPRASGRGSATAAALRKSSTMNATPNAAPLRPLSDRVGSDAIDMMPPRGGRVERKDVGATTVCRPDTFGWISQAEREAACSTAWVPVSAVRCRTAR
jgi:hypothetical protein